METSTMIRQLRRTAKKHENDKLWTFDTNITAMCRDVANRLEQLDQENRKIRAKTIDEFVDRSWGVLGADDRDIYAKESIKEIAELMREECDE